jgi:hypothetical protein
MKYIFFIIFLSGCVAQTTDTEEFSYLGLEAKSVCEVLARRSQFVGQHLTVEGIYFQTPHERLLVDDDCPQWSLRVSHSLQVPGNREAEAVVERFRRVDPTVGIPVVYSGTLRATLVMSDCTDPSCYSYSFEQAQLLVASPRKRISRGR